MMTARRRACRCAAARRRDPAWHESCVSRGGAAWVCVARSGDPLSSRGCVRVCGRAFRRSVADHRCVFSPLFWGGFWRWRHAARPLRRSDRRCPPRRCAQRRRFVSFRAPHNQRKPFDHSVDPRARVCGVLHGLHEAPPLLRLQVAQDHVRSPPARLPPALPAVKILPPAAKTQPRARRATRGARASCSSDAPLRVVCRSRVVPLPTRRRERSAVRRCR